MPNYVTNIVKIKAPNKATLDDFIESIKNDGNAIDFNNIIPMPQSLNLVSGGQQDSALMAYLTNNCEKKLTPALKKKCIAYGIKNSYSKDWAADVYSRTQKLLEENGPSHRYKIKEDGTEFTLYDGGAMYAFNIETYGAATWYSWCVDHWGTKWNAMDSELYNGADEVTAELVFLTAWSAANPILDAMAEQNPALKLRHEWADEDVGYNCGYAEYKNGRLRKSNDFSDEDDPKKSLKFACSVLGCSPEDFED